MTSTHWEKVGPGRYASELHGHVIQAIRRDGPHQSTDRPYIAVVDRVPVGDAWNLSIAKTKCIQFVERQGHKAKAERVFKANGHKPAEAPPIPPEPILDTHGEQIGEFIPFTEPVQIPNGPVQSTNEPVQPEPYPVEKLALTLPIPGQLAITGRLAEGDLLNTLTALRSTLELMREHAELECTVNLPPILKL